MNERTLMRLYGVMVEPESKLLSTDDQVLMRRAWNVPWAERGIGWANVLSYLELHGVFTLEDLARTMARDFPAVEASINGPRRAPVQDVVQDHLQSRL